MKITVDQALKKGIEAQEVGKAREAGNYYAAILKLQPNHPDANHNMGILAVSIGKINEALPFFKTAVEVGSNTRQFWLSYLNALMELNRFDEAHAMLEKARSTGLKDDFFDQVETRLSMRQESESDIGNNKLTEKGNILDELKLDQALKLAEKKEKDGLNAQAKYIYEEILQKFPKNKRAIISLKRLSNKFLSNKLNAQEPSEIKIQPIINKIRNGQHQEVLKEASMLLEEFPNSLNLYNIIGVANKSLGNLDEAISAFRKALSIRPDYPEAHNNIGVTFNEQGKQTEAIKAYKKAVALKPDFSEAYNNIGKTYKEQGMLEEAVRAYNKAILVQPHYAEAYNNLGLVQKNKGDLNESIKTYKKALAIKPDLAEAHLNLSFALINSGRYKTGLEEYEWRWKTTEFLDRKRFFHKPLWDGKESLKSKTILVWGEQGPQDMIVWSSALEYLSDRSSHCILECPHKLVPLLARSLPNITVKTENTSLDMNREDFDFHIPMGSLFKCLFSKISKRRISKPFLKTDLKRVEYWKSKLKKLGTGPFIGISWKSPVITPERSPNYTNLGEWKPILGLPNVTFINLQSADFKKDLQKIQNSFGVNVHHFEELDQYNNLDDVAALCQALDYCISVSTAVAAIAAGVGTPTKLLSWKQSPWNNFLFKPCGPSVTNYPRNTWEPWGDILEKVARDLKAS